MAMSIAGINIPDSIINAEWRIGVLEKMVERLSQLAPPGAITQSDVDKFRREIFADLQKKYPDAGLELNEKKT